MQNQIQSIVGLGWILAVTFDEKYERKYNEAEMTMASSNLPHQSWITNIGMTKSRTVIPVHNVKAIKTEKKMPFEKIVAKTKQCRANQQHINSTSKVDVDISKESINEQTVEEDLTGLGGINFNNTTKRSITICLKYYNTIIHNDIGRRMNIPIDTS